MDENCSRTTIMAKMSRIWPRDSMKKHRLFTGYMRVVFIRVHGCEKWTLLPYTKKRIQESKTKCLRKPLGISSREHSTNNFRWSVVAALVKQQLLLAIREVM